MAGIKDESNSDALEPLATGNRAGQPGCELTGVGLEHWGREFPSTHWSVVFDDNDVAQAGSVTQRMLELLCSQYWYPVYAYLRKKGHASHDAQDLTQGFS